MAAGRTWSGTCEGLEEVKVEEDVAFSPCRRHRYRRRGGTAGWVESHAAREEGNGVAAQERSLFTTVHNLSTVVSIAHTFLL